MAPTSSLACEPSATVGSTVPRLWTRPLVSGAPGPCGCGCALTPETSYGFEFVELCDGLGWRLLPWQRWLSIHAGELRPSGLPRFRRVLVLVARQNGKTHLLAMLALYWLFVRRAPSVLGTSTKLEYAQDAWEKSVALALDSDPLRDLLPERRPHGVRRTNGSVSLRTLDSCEYRIAPANEEGGRSKTIGFALCDELRQHHDYSAWDAVVPATNAVPDAQVWGISNAGGDRSTVLNDLRTAALKGEDDLLGHFEWSAPDGADPEDPEALLAANPSAGHLQSLDVLLADARAAKAVGGERLTGFRTEILCQRVRSLDPAIDPAAWAACLDPGTLDDVRSRVSLCLDVSLDQLHATLVAAAVLPDGRVRVEPVAAWDGPGCATRAAAELPALVQRVRPQMLGWLPGGPAATLAADLKDRPGRPWPPPGVQVEEIRSEVTAVCMGLAALVLAPGRLVHSGDPLLDAQVAVAEKLHQVDAWRFTRKGVVPCDAVYAAAGAVHLARTAPAPLGPQRVVLPRSLRR